MVNQSASRYVSAAEAAALLHITRPTLYAYASRGLLHSEAVPDRPRATRYRRDEVERLQARRAARRDPARAAAQGLDWGAPVLDSALTLIEGGHLYYRGRDALALARHASVEAVAALLWTGDPARASGLFASGAGAVAPAGIRLAGRVPGLGPIERCQVALAVGAAADLAAHEADPATGAATGARILELLAAVVSGRLAGPVARRLREAWAPGRPGAEAALRAALVLCADHELNVSAFTARCVASAGASLYDVVAAALAALKGGRHGGQTARVEALLREAGTPARARETLGDRLRRGEPIPGFGHVLYPDGDPRGAALLELARAARLPGAGLELVDAVVDAARALTGRAPTLDVGLVALGRAWRLPEGSALTLFALGRTIGWIGHALEQYALGRLIRPRARYVGPPPAP
jgi:citrate synthase